MSDDMSDDATRETPPLRTTNVARGFSYQEPLLFERTTDSPRPAASRAMPAPLTPPPITKRSTVSSSGKTDSPLGLRNSVRSAPLDAITGALKIGCDKAFVNMARMADSQGK